MTLRKLILTAALVALTGVAQAGPLGLFPRLGGGRCQPAPAVRTTPAATTTPVAAGSGGLQWKADAQARSGRCFHPGGGFVAGASYEGVGYSSVSPQDALAHCCNNGGPVVAQAVSQGPGGWYAVKQYATPGSGPVRTAVSGTLQTAGATLQSAGQVIQNVGTLTLPVRHTTVYRPEWSAPTCADGNCPRIPATALPTGR